MSADATEDLPEEILTELRRQIFDRLAVRRQDGSLILCPCSRARSKYGSRPKVSYADYDDARMAARALVQLPGATPIRMYPCSMTAGQWHLSSIISSKGRKGRNLTIWPPGHEDAPADR